METKPEEGAIQDERQEPEEKEYVIRIRVPKFPHLVRGEALDHIRAAQKETLLAFRSLLDAAIECVEPKPKTEGKGPTKIEVE
ncbi:MAG: hypothetical protein HYX94_11315 [Chloroflexi bacterium]|nr:hypothetical protein [Chloroflexota bacterium]